MRTKINISRKWVFDQTPISQALLQETYGKQWGEVVLRVKGLIATGLKTDICLRHPKIKQTSVQLVFFDTTFREWKISSFVREKQIWIQGVNKLPRNSLTTT